MLTNNKTTILKIKFLSYTQKDLIKLKNQLPLIFSKITFKKINLKNETSIKKKKSNFYTILKSPHVHKKSREQFAYLNYEFSIIFEHYNPIVLFFLIKYCKTRLEFGSILICRISK